MKVTFTTILQWMVLVVVVVLIFSETAVYVPPLKATRSFTVSFQARPGEVLVQSNLWSSYTGTYRQSVDWANDTSTVRTIYYFYDPDYPTSFSNLNSWYGVPQYLNIVSSNRDLSLSIVVLDATELASLLTNPATAVGSLLVFASGAFPSTVYTASNNLVLPWLQAGGRLVWIGDAIGYYSAQAGQPLSGGDNNPGLNGTESFLGLHDFGSLPAYTVPSMLSSALNLDWLSYSLPSFGLNSSEVSAHNGLVEGNLMNGFTNAALLPVGSGAILDIASPLVVGSEERFAISVVNLIQLGLLYPTTRLVSEANRTVDSDSSVAWNENVVLGGPSTISSWNLCVFTEQVDMTALYGDSSCLSGFPPP